MRELISWLKIPPSFFRSQLVATKPVPKLGAFFVLEVLLGKSYLSNEIWNETCLSIPQENPWHSFFSKCPHSKFTLLLFRCSIQSCVYPCKFQLTMVTSSMIARWNKEDEVIVLPATPGHTLAGSMYRESMPLVLLMLASIFTPRLHKLVLAPYFPWCFWNKNFSASFPIKNLQNCPRVLLDSSTKGHSFNMAPCRSTTTPFPLPGLHRHLAAFLCVLYPLTCHQQLIFSQPERRTCPNIGTDLDRFGNTVEGSDIRLSLTSWGW